MREVAGPKIDGLEQCFIGLRAGRAQWSILECIKKKVVDILLMMLE
jgi:hypothetical protein